MTAGPTTDPAGTEVERIDREWQRERRKYLTVDRRGRLREPGVLDGLVKAAFFVLFGLIGTVLVTAMSIPGERLIEIEITPSRLWVFLVFVWSLAGLGVVLSIRAVARAERYYQAKAEYERRRGGSTVPGPSPPPPD